MLIKMKILHNSEDFDVFEPSDAESDNDEEEESLG